MKSIAFVPTAMPAATGTARRQLTPRQTQAVSGGLRMLGPRKQSSPSSDPVFGPFSPDVPNGTWNFYF